MLKITVSTTNDYLAKLAAGMDAVGRGAMPNTSDAFRKAATKLILPIWKGIAAGGEFNGFRLKHAYPGYVASIQARQTSPYNWEIYSRRAIAKWIEYGTKEVDFKTTHPYGKKSRVTKRKTEKYPGGVPYLIVPIRHKTPGARGSDIPMRIYQQVQAAIKNAQFQKSVKVQGTKTDPNYAGELIPRQSYAWGSRVKGLKEMLPNLEGMVVFDTSDKGPVHSTYFTFRVISADSPQGSWIKPATPPMHVTKAVVEGTKNEVLELIRLGMEADLGI